MPLEVLSILSLYDKNSRYILTKAQILSSNLKLFVHSYIQKLNSKHKHSPPFLFSREKNISFLLIVRFYQVIQATFSSPIIMQLIFSYKYHIPATVLEMDYKQPQVNNGNIYQHR